MTRDNKKRYTQYKICGIRFTDGKKTIELGRSYDRKEVSLYMAKDDIWKQVVNIFNNLMTVKDISLDNGNKSISFEVEDVLFEKGIHEDDDDDNQKLAL